VALLSGCAMTDSQKDTTRRTASGAAIGAIGGWLYDHHKKKEETPGY
jgi:hypothetical protein